MAADQNGGICGQSAEIHMKTGVFHLLKMAWYHPLTCRLELDDPRTTGLRRQIIQNKAFLRRVYQTWYRMLAAHLPGGDGSVLELGSGAGFLKDFLPKAITSEVFHTEWIDLACNAMTLPFRTGSLQAVLLIDTLHHIPDPIRFFDEATRCVRSGGRCLLIEPWNTSWGRLIYTYFHHEPFDTAGGWTLPGGGPLSCANGALPWILFQRDRRVFEKRFPSLRIAAVSVIMPFVYLLSGGVSSRMGFPVACYPVVRRIEKLFERNGSAGMFAFIRLDRA